eukprot:750989-Hanusia_phi.AAC.9
MVNVQVPSHPALPRAKHLAMEGSLLREEGRGGERKGEEEKRGTEEEARYPHAPPCDVGAQTGGDGGVSKVMPQLRSVQVPSLVLEEATVSARWCEQREEREDALHAEERGQIGTSQGAEETRASRWNKLVRLFGRWTS